MEGKVAVDASILIVDGAACDLAETVDCELENGVAALAGSIGAVPQTSEDNFLTFVVQEDVA